MDNIQHKRGLAATAPRLLSGQIGYCTDTKKLMVGTDAGNVIINDYSDVLALIADIDARLQKLEKGVVK